ncbi:hypothetical protein [Subsaximicrobium wynnwilliamsii]|uniref:hypothetical protein n=1 Tax=Subsaximicrobium wynnwilliamsii TaxID=291179 RepID=UPI00167C2D3B|nr:hypothetical protein [Subsaximicrobium wynnwilliamsii]
MKLNLKNQRVVKLEHSLLIVFLAHNPQPTTHNPQPTTHNPQLTAHDSQLTAHNPQPNFHRFGSL